jgi:hypothetical protein
MVCYRCRARDRCRSRESCVCGWEARPNPSQHFDENSRLTVKRNCEILPNLIL